MTTKPTKNLQEIKKLHEKDSVQWTNLPRSTHYSNANCKVSYCTLQLCPDSTVSQLIVGRATNSGQYDYKHVSFVSDIRVWHFGKGPSCLTCFMFVLPCIFGVIWVANGNLRIVSGWFGTSPSMHGCLRPWRHLNREWQSQNQLCTITHKKLKR